MFPVKFYCLITVKKITIVFKRNEKPVHFKTNRLQQRQGLFSFVYGKSLSIIIYMKRNKENAYL
jgi:hypothetical protein